MIEDWDAYRRNQGTSALPNENETFLIEEGLELLSSFRAINDRDARKAILAFIHVLAKADWPDNKVMKEP